MKSFTLPLVLLFSVCCFAQTQTFHDFSGNTILGDPLSFSTYYGKKVMVVNTATYCSYTPQYQELESLYTQYKDTSNFMIVGFPCNDFAFQEPHNDSSINAFCIDEYGIEFQMMSKVSIIGQDTAEVYKWLQKQARNGVQDASVTWNFNKFLIDEAGQWVAHYPQQTSPYDPEIIAWLKTPTVIDSTNTGIRDAELDMKARVVSDRLQITFGSALNSKTNINLYSVSGQFLSAIHSGALPQGEQVTADISSLSNGVYFVKASNGQGSKTFRFSVVR